MAKYPKAATIIPVVLLGIVLQVLLGFADVQDSPSRAVIEFSKAYFRMDPSMTRWICDDKKSGSGATPIERYLQRTDQEARERGFSRWYLGDCLYEVETHTRRKDDTQAEVRITALRKAPLRHFFTGEAQHVDEIVQVVKQDGQWKVCGQPFALAQN